MGVGKSKLNREALAEYADLTYFNEGEIVELFKKFESLDQSIQSDPKGRISASNIKSLPELKLNPFADRICEVFSSADDKSMNFDDFLDMMNVLSENASFSLKAHYAFSIFDFNKNGYVDEEDIGKIVECITNDQDGLKDRALTSNLIEKIMEEADLDRDNQLGRSEFEHVLSKSPDFLSSFKIRL
ncbi:calcium and integrin-binding protein 1-like [Clavelina lepadiformis]|uniref:calcium and integrin-binding protein 1-like n=1 Tax=Clavelina lepadiformis TaxID=159417 RepID=UPI0040425095